MLAIIMKLRDKTCRLGIAVSFLVVFKLIKTSVQSSIDRKRSYISISQHVVDVGPTLTLVLPHSSIKQNLPDRLKRDLCLGVVPHHIFDNRPILITPATLMETQCPVLVHRG